MTVIGSTGARPLNPFRPSATGSGLEATADPAGRALSVVRQMVEEGGDLRKAAAKEKMERIKDRVKMLVQMNLPPDVLARQLAMLGQQLASVAGQLTGSAAMSIGAGETAGTGPATAPPESGDDVAAEGAQDEASETRAPWGYGEAETFGNDEPDDADRETIRALRGLAMQIKAMLRQAESDMRRETGARSTSQEDLPELDAALSALGGGAGETSFTLTL